MTTKHLHENKYASLTDVKANPCKVLDEAGGKTIAVLENDEPRFYMVPPKLYTAMQNILRQLDTQPASHAASTPHLSEEDLIKIATRAEERLANGSYPKGGFEEH